MNEAFFVVEKDKRSFADNNNNDKLGWPNKQLRSEAVDWNIVWTKEKPAESFWRANDGDEFVR